MRWLWASIAALFIVGAVWIECAHAGDTMMNVGRLMGSSKVTHVAPPTHSKITTESGVTITTENNIPLVIETAPPPVALTTENGNRITTENGVVIGVEGNP